MNPSDKPIGSHDDLDDVDPGNIDPGSIDAGEPIAELAMLGEAPGREFRARIDAGIHRRSLVSQCIDFSAHAFLSFVAEVTMIISYILGREDSDEGDRHG